MISDIIKTQSLYTDKELLVY